MTSDHQASQMFIIPLKRKLVWTRELQVLWLIKKMEHFWFQIQQCHMLEDCTLCTMLVLFLSQGIQ